jgi:hypothetical protein
MSGVSTYGIYEFNAIQSTPTLKNIFTIPYNFVTSIVCSNDGKRVVYAHSNGSRVNTSQDYGENWRLTSWISGNVFVGVSVTYNNFSGIEFSDLTSSSNGKYLIGTATKNNPSSKSIVYSHDYGNNWYLSGSATTSSATNVTSSSSGQYAIAINGSSAGNNVHISNDYGVTWTVPTFRLSKISQSLSGKYAVGTTPTQIYFSDNFGNTWTNKAISIANYGFDVSQNLNAVKISGDGKRCVVSINPTTVDALNGGMLISRDFGTTWSKLQNAPKLKCVKIASSENLQYLIIGCNVYNALPNRFHNVHISNDFGTNWIRLADSSDTRDFDNSNHVGELDICTTSSGQYGFVLPFANNKLYNYVANNYTYSYTPIRMSYDNSFNFTFTSKLYDCSGTYYLKNNNSQILATKVVNENYTETITFTGIDTMAFDYGNNTLLVYKQNDNLLDDPGYDIQISDPMAVNATCFLEGTKILAMDKKRILKYIPIEKLKPGMLVQTLSSGLVPIKYIGYFTLYNPGLATRVRDQLFVCKKSAYPELREDLVLTGNHSILVDTITDEESEQITETLGDIYVTEKKYRLPAFNDKRAEPYDKRGEFRIWNLALENENYYANYGIFANGLLVETTSCRYIKEISKMTLIEKE